MNTTKFWEVIGYIVLALAVFGMVTVGYYFLIAQFAYLLSNSLSLIRDFAIKLPNSNKVRDAAFTGITIALIILRII